MLDRKPRQRWRTLRRKILEQECVWCGTWFEVDPTRQPPRRTCSNSCRSMLSRKLRKGSV